MVKQLIIATLVCVAILGALLLFTSESKFLPLIYRIF